MVFVNYDNKMLAISAIPYDITDLSTPFAWKNM